MYRFGYGVMEAALTKMPSVYRIKYAEHPNWRAKYLLHLWYKGKAKMLQRRSLWRITGFPAWVTETKMRSLLLPLQVFCITWRPPATST